MEGPTAISGFPMLRWKAPLGWVAQESAGREASCRGLQVLSCQWHSEASTCRGRYLRVLMATSLKPASSGEPIRSVGCAGVPAHLEPLPVGHPPAGGACSQVASTRTKRHRVPSQEASFRRKFWGFDSPWALAIVGAF